MATSANDQFHRDKSFSEGDAQPFGTEARHGARPGAQDPAEMAANGANPDPVGVTTSAPEIGDSRRPNTLNPTNDQAQTGAQQYMPGPGMSSAPSAAGAGNTSARRVATAQGIDLNSRTDGPVDESTRGEGADAGPATNAGVEPRGMARRGGDPADTLLTDAGRASS